MLHTIHENSQRHVFFSCWIAFLRPTYKRIIRNKSTEQFSGLPYVYSLLNCLICMWYGLPCVSYGVILVATVNSIGAAFQLVYVTLFIIYADTTRKVYSFIFCLAWLLKQLLYFRKQKLLEMRHWCRQKARSFCSGGKQNGFPDSVSTAKALIWSFYLTCCQ